MRYALNNMQAVHAGAGKITYDAVFKICDVPRPERIDEIISTCVKGDLEKACDIVDGMWKEGYSGYDILNAIYRALVNTEVLKEV